MLTLALLAPQDVPLRKMFFWCAVIGTTLGLSQIILVTGRAQCSTLPACLVIPHSM